jgi:hypothetical protein
LMFTAQNQADFKAATGNVTHSGPGGIGLTERLLAAGYPLAGDLSAGGFRAENITSGRDGMSAQAVIDGWMGDAPHQNTAFTDLTELARCFGSEWQGLLCDRLCATYNQRRTSSQCPIVGSGQPSRGRSAKYRCADTPRNWGRDP